MTTPNHDKYLQGMQAALRLLHLRDRTEAELAQALSTKGLMEPELGLVLRTLRELRYLDDERIASRAVERGQLKGRALIEYELQQRGTEPEVTARATGALSETETERAEAIFQQTRKPLDTPAKAAARLARKGFDEDIVRTVIERHFPEFD